MIIFFLLPLDNSRGKKKKKKKATEKPTNQPASAEPGSPRRARQKEVHQQGTATATSFLTRRQWQGIRQTNPHLPPPAWVNACRALRRTWWRLPMPR